MVGSELSNDALLRAAIDNIPSYVFLVDEDHRILLANRAVLDLLGREPHQVVGAYCPELMHGLSSPYPGCPLEEAVAAGDACRQSCIHDAGSGRWMRTSVHRTDLRTERGGHVYLHLAEDVTEQRQAERLREQSLRDFRTVFDHAGDTMAIVSREGRFLAMNRVGCERLGFRRDELLAMGPADILAPEERGEVPAQLKRIQETGVHQFETTELGRDGRRAPVEVVASRIEYEGRPAVLAVVRDLTRHKLAAEELRRARDTQSAISSILLLALEDVPLDDLLADVLHATLSVPWLGVERRGAIFLTAGDPPALQMRASEGLDEPVLAACARVPFGHCVCGQAARSGETQVVSSLDELHANRCSGIVDHGHCCVPVRHGGATLGVLCTYLAPGQPLHELELEFLHAVADTLAGVLARRKADEARRQADEQLRQVQKLDAVGRLAGGIAHDFNNILTVIIAMADTASSELEPTDPLRADLAEILAAAGRGTGLTRRLLAFCRQEASRVEKLSVRTVVADIEVMLRRLLGTRINLRSVLPTNPCLVWMDRTQLEQVIVNLAVNARDASPAGGRITIEVCEAATRPRPQVALSVTDEGHGITPEVRERLFEPFFTTKQPGEGTGLGLAVVQGIVEEAGGTIEVDSAPGQETTFRVLLPAADEARHFRQAPARRLSLGHLGPSDSAPSTRPSQASSGPPGEW